MADSICKRCFHSYVCEQYNEHRDCDNERCHFFNDHFADADSVVVREKGEWLEHYGITICPRCNAMFDEPLTMIQIPSTFENPNFCPNCGADMRKDDNDVR